MKRAPVMAYLAAHVERRTGILMTTGAARGEPRAQLQKFRFSSAQARYEKKKKKKRSGEHFYIGQTSLLLTDESIPSK